MPATAVFQEVLAVERVRFGIELIAALSGTAPALILAGCQPQKGVDIWPTPNTLPREFWLSTRSLGRFAAASLLAFQSRLAGFFVVYYIELGGDYFEKRNKQQLERRLVKRLEQLGHNVVLEPAMSV